MAQFFRLPNFPDINLQDQTQLTADASSGQKNITVISAEGFAVDDIVLIGNVGSGFGEIGVIDTISGVTISFDNNLTTNHRNTEPITQLFGDQIKAYRVLNTNNYPPDDATFAANPLGSPFAIDYDGPVTLFNDNTGSNQYWYKFVFHNSITGAETNLSSSVAIRGGINHYCSIEDARREAGLLQANQIQDTQVATRRDHAESEVDGALIAAGYSLPLVDARGNSFIPAMVSNATRLLTAGYILLQDYGPVAAGDTKDGDKKLKDGRDILSKIQDHTYILVDSNKQLMATNTRIKGTPTDQTMTTGNDTYRGNPPEPALFTISRKF